MTDDRHKFLGVVEVFVYANSYIVQPAPEARTLNAPVAIAVEASRPDHDSDYSDERLRAAIRRSVRRADDD